MSKPKKVARQSIDDAAAKAAAAKAKAEADAAATAAANTTLADEARRKRGQRGLLTSEEANTVLARAGAAANMTSNATVLGSGGG